MCGRIACSLGDEDLSCATCYKDEKTGLYTKIPFNEGFKPSCNIPPTMQAPIIINEAKHKHEPYKPLIVLARFGVIPPWLEFNDPSCRSNQYEMHLCRLETVSSKKVHNRLLNNGFRCIIPCTAYYEWQTTSGPTKQPFCFFNKANELERLVKTGGLFDPQSGWNGVKLLYLAGFYNIHTDPTNESKKLYSFAIITHETNEEWMFVHHRMPAVLQTEQDIKDWLDSPNVDKEMALQIISKPIVNLNAHAVDKTIVNAPKQHTGTNCLNKYEPKKSKFLNDWLNSGSNNHGSSTKTKITNQAKKEDKKKPNFMSQWLQKKRPAEHNENDNPKEKKAKMN